MLLKQLSISEEEFSLIIEALSEHLLPMLAQIDTAAARHDSSIVSAFLLRLAAAPVV